MTPYEQALSIIKVILGNEPIVTTELVRRTVAEWLPRVPGCADVDPRYLARQLESDFNVHVGEATQLDDSAGHVPWKPERWKTIEWSFWRRYERYLLDLRRMPPPSVRRIEDISEDILQQLEDPERPGPWDR